MKPTLAVLFFALLTHIAAGQKTEFHLFTTADGLPQNSIGGIAQDAQGYFWIVTNGQLSRFDGSQFLNRSNSKHPVFQHSWTGYFLLNISGKRLIFTNEGLVFSINTSTGEETAEPLAPHLPADADVSKAYTLKMPTGDILAVCGSHEQQGKRYFLNLENGKIGRRFEVEGIFGIITNEAACGDSEGNIFMLDRLGSRVLKFDRNGLKLLELALPSRSQNPFVRLRAGCNGSIFLSLDNKIWRLATGATTWQAHPVSKSLNWEVYITDLWETSEGNLWVCGANSHMAFFDSRTGKIRDFYKELDKIYAHPALIPKILPTTSGSDETVWVTSNEGLLRVRPQKHLFDVYFDEARDECKGFCSFRGFAEDSAGNVYASFYSNIFKIPCTESKSRSNLNLPKHAKSDHLPTPLLPQQPQMPFDLFCLNGKLLLNDGYIFDLKTRRLWHPNRQGDTGDFSLFAHDEQTGRIWRVHKQNFYELENVGDTHVGVASKSSNAHFRWKPLPMVPSQREIADITWDVRSRRVWLLDNSEIFTFDPERNVFEKLPAPNDWNFNNLKCLWPDGSGKFWLGSEQGLLHLDPAAKTLKKYGREEGLPNEIVVGILPEGDSALWLSTFNGLSRLDLRTLKFLNFFKTDGLADNEFNRVSFFKASDGRMFFGGTKGVTAFYPKQVMEKYALHRRGEHLQLRSISMTEDGSDSVLIRVFHDPRQVLDVFHTNRTVEFEFGVFGTSASEQVLFSHQIEGLSKTWSQPSKNGSVTFSGLPPRDYVFRARAMNARGQWLPTEISLPIRVHAPWWATWWAYLLYGMAILGLATGVAVYLRTARDRELIAQQKFALEQSLAEKETLLREIHHRVKNNLQIISGLLERQSRKTDDETTKKLMREGQDRVLSMALVHQNLYNSENLGAVEIKNYIDVLAKNIQATQQQPEQKIELLLDVDDSTLAIDHAIPLALILNELITNCFKYAFQGRATGQIRVDFHRRAEQSFLKVWDNGVGLPEGFDVSKNPNLGLNLVRGLTRQLGGSLDFRSSFEGTSFDLVF